MMDVDKNKIIAVTIISCVAIVSVVGFQYLLLRPYVKTVVDAVTVTTTFTDVEYTRVTTTSTITGGTDGIIPEKIRVTYNYSYDGHRTVHYSNGTSIESLDKGLYKNQSISAYLEYDGVSKITYPRDPKPFQTYTLVNPTQTNLDTIGILSLIENIRSGKYNVTYTRTSNNSTHIIIEGLKAEISSVNYSFLNDKVRFKGHSLLSIKYLAFNPLDRTYRIDDMRIVLGTGERSKINFVFHVHHLFFEEESRD